MQISRTQVQNLLKDIAKNKKTNESKCDIKVNRTMAKDVSETGKAYHIAKKVINDSPEIREDRLADVQKAIKTGTYTVSDEEIAEKMISRSLVDKLV